MARLLRFGRFEFDPDTLDLRKAGRPVRLPPQPARVLAALLRRPGRLCTREGLQDEVWPDGTSEITRDQGLNTCIRQIRDALGESAASPVYIETQHRHGYRFIAPVEVLDEEAWPSVGFEGHASPSRRTTRRLGVAALFVATALAAAFAVARLDHEGQLAVAEATDPAQGAEPAAATLPQPAILPQPGPESRLAYLKGRHLLGLETREGAERSISYLRKTVDRDPDFAPGHALLAEALFWTGRRSAAEASARRALDLAPDLAKAHVVLANILLDRDFDWESARRHYERAIAADPGRSEFHHAFAHYLTASGRHDEALERLARALELDPLSPAVHGDEGWVQYWAGDYGTAAARCREAAMLMAAAIRARAERCALQALARLRRYAEAREHALRIMTLAGADREAVSRVGSGSARDGLKAYFAWAVLPENRATALGGDSAYRLARGYADLGRNEAALAALEKALETRPRGLVTIAVEPRFDGLRDDPRFRRIVKEIGLSERLAAAPKRSGRMN